MSENQVTYEQRDRVAYIRLADPERGNPINQPMVKQLGVAVRRARADDVHVVVLSSNGRVFSFGGDLQAFSATDNVEHMIDDLAESLHRVISELHHMDAIVVSVVNGMAAGAGVPLAASADVVLAAESARFSLSYTKVGLSPDGGSSLLIASIGLHRALGLALLNPVLSALETVSGLRHRGPSRRRTRGCNREGDQRAAVGFTFCAKFGETTLSRDRHELGGSCTSARDALDPVLCSQSGRQGRCRSLLGKASCRLSQQPLTQEVCGNQFPWNP